MEEKASYLERTLGPNNPKTGIALLFLARGYLHTGSVLGADKALFALHKALETLQGYARLVHAPLSAQASKMFDYLKNHIMAAKASAARTQQAAEAAAQAAADAGIGPGIAGRRKSELEGPIAAGGANGLTGHAPGATAARAGGGGSEDGLGVPPQDGKGAGGARAGVGSGGREGS